MFKKRFNQARSATKLFNEANKHWVQAGQSLQAKDEPKLAKDLIEVIKLCQLSIEADEQYGDSYILLADALLLAGTSDPRKNRERSWFLITRAAAVIRAWYSLPHRGYPITKNMARGEQLYQTILEIVNVGEIQSKDDTMRLIDTYRDTLAAKTISCAGLNEISNVILNISVPTKPDSMEFQSQSQFTNQWPEETLPAPLAEFLLFKVAADLRIRNNSENMPDTILVPRVTDEIMGRIQEASGEKDWRQLLGWIVDLRLINSYCQKNLVYDETILMKIEAEWAKLLAPITNEARQSKDYDTLILAIGFYHHLVMDDVAALLLKQVQNELSEHELHSRMHNIEDNPRMMFEAAIISKARDFLKSTKLGC